MCTCEYIEIISKAVFTLQVERSLETLLYHYVSVDTVSNVDCLGCSNFKKRPPGCKDPLKKTTFKKKLTIGKVRTLCRSLR